MFQVLYYEEDTTLVFKVAEGMVFYFDGTLFNPCYSFPEERAEFLRRVYNV